MRTRSLFTAVAVVCAAAPGITACGVPSSSKAEQVEEAPTDFDQSLETAQDPFTPHVEADTTVMNFLKAPAGEAGTRADRLNVFGADLEIADSEGPVDLLDDVELSVDMAEGFLKTTVTITGSVTGAYLSDGQVRMNTIPRDYEETFDLAREDLQDAWTITNAPNQVTLLYSQFKLDYELTPLYFQATGQDDLLVPDLRWVYRSLTPEADHNLRLRWLLSGSSEWVGQSARSAIPAGSDGSTSENDGLLTVDLVLSDTSEFDAETIAAQIAWSLDLDEEFELRIDGESVETSDLADWRNRNAIPRETDEIGYFIAEETIWQFDDDEIDSESSDHPWVGLQLPGLSEVAVNDRGRVAAVTIDGDTMRLQIGTDSENMEPVEGFDGDLHDPQWVREDTVLVVADGVITAVNVNTGSTQVIAGEDVTALAVAPDARRLIYVADAKAFAAPLTHDADGNLQIGDPRRIGLDIADVGGVAWSAEDTVWIFRARDGSTDQLLRVTLDNAVTENQPGSTGVPQVTDIAARPADPTGRADRGEPVVVVIEGNLHRVDSSAMPRIEDSRTGESVPGSAPFTILD